VLCAGLLCSCARAFIVLANPRVGARERGMEDWQRKKVVYGPSREGRIWCGQEMSGNAWWSYSPPNSRKEYETRHILSAHLGRADRPNIRSRPNRRTLQSAEYDDGTRCPWRQRSPPPRTAPRQCSHLMAPRRRQGHRRRQSLVPPSGAKGGRAGAWPPLMLR